MQGAGPAHAWRKTKVVGSDPQLLHCLLAAPGPRGSARTWPFTRCLLSLGRARCGARGELCSCSVRGCSVLPWGEMLPVLVPALLFADKVRRRGQCSRSAVA